VDGSWKLYSWVATGAEENCSEGKDSNGADLNSTLLFCEVTLAGDEMSALSCWGADGLCWFLCWNSFSCKIISPHLKNLIYYTFFSICVIQIRGQLFLGKFLSHKIITNLFLCIIKHKQTLRKRPTKSLMH